MTKPNYENDKKSAFKISEPSNPLNLKKPTNHKKLNLGESNLLYKLFHSVIDQIISRYITTQNTLGVPKGKYS